MNSPMTKIIMNILIKRENKNYIFIIASNQSEDSILLIIHQSSYIYCKKCELNYFQNIKFFKNCNNFEIIIETLKNIFISKKNLISIEEEENKQIKLSLDIEISISGLNIILEKHKLEFILLNEEKELIFQYNLIWDGVLFLFKENENNINEQIKNKNKLDELNKEISNLNEMIQDLQKLKENEKHNNKLNDFNKSLIINEINIEKFNFIKQKIITIFMKKNIKFKMIYNAKINGDTSKSFHELCDNHKNTLVILQTDTNNIFGGFASKTWNSMELGRKKDIKSFIFSLNKQKIYNAKISDKERSRYHLYCSDTDGPSFYAFSIEDSFLKNGGFCDEIKKCNFDSLEIEYELNDGNKNFMVKQLEIYEILFDN